MSSFDYKSCAVIYNPVASKFNEEILNKVYKELISLGLEVKLCQSKKKGHVIDLIQENNERDLIITMGGDGTVGEAYRAFDTIDQHSTYAHLSTGTTNDMAINFNLIRNDPLKSLRVLIEKGQEKSIDLLRMNDQSFAYISAFGYLAHIPYITNSSLKAKLGHGAYIGTGLFHLLDLQKLNIDYEIDGKTYNTDCILGMISNFKESAGVALHPYADPADGKFEVLFLKKITPSGFLKVFPQYLKKQIDLKGVDELVDVIQTDNIKIKFNQIPRHDLDNDGDRAKASLNEENNTVCYTAGKKIKILMPN